MTDEEERRLAVIRDECGDDDSHDICNAEVKFLFRVIDRLRDRFDNSIREQKLAHRRTRKWQEKAVQLKEENERLKRGEVGWKTGF